MLQHHIVCILTTGEAYGEVLSARQMFRSLVDSARTADTERHLDKLQNCNATVFRYVLHCCHVLICRTETERRGLLQLLEHACSKVSTSVNWSVEGSRETMNGPSRSV